MKTIEKWIIVVLSVIAVASIGVAVYFGFRITKDTSKREEIMENEKQENVINNDNLDKEDSEHEEYDSTDIRIFSTEGFKINYIKSHIGYDGTNYCKINDKGFLEGFCYSEEIKDIQFIALAERFYEFYPDGIYALSTEGFIYELDYNSKYDANDKLVKIKDADVSKFKTKHDGKITNIGFVESNVFGECDINSELIYTADKINYVYDGETTFEDRIKDESLYMLVSCGIGGNASELTEVSLNYDKTIKLNNGVNVKDVSTKKDIIAKYVAYEYKENKETIYIVSDDNKLYKMYKEEEFINSVDTVLDVKYSYIELDNKKDLEIKTNDEIIILSGY